MTKLDERDMARDLRGQEWRYRSAAVTREALRRQGVFSRWVATSMELDMLSVLSGEWGRLN